MDGRNELITGRDDGGKTVAESGSRAAQLRSSFESWKKKHAGCFSVALGRLVHSRLRN